MKWLNYPGFLSDRTREEILVISTQGSDHRRERWPDKRKAEWSEPQFLVPNRHRFETSSFHFERKDKKIFISKRKAFNSIFLSRNNWNDFKMLTIQHHKPWKAVDKQLTWRRSRRRRRRLLCLRRSYFFSTRTTAKWIYRAASIVIKILWQLFCCPAYHNTQRVYILQGNWNPRGVKILKIFNLRNHPNLATLFTSQQRRFSKAGHVGGM